MNHEENYFLTQNKLIEERLDCCLHVIESRLDELNHRDSCKSSNAAVKFSDYSSQSFITFQSPYIRDCRGFSAPSNEDLKQIKELTGTEDIELLIKHKQWSNESKKQLREAVLEQYSIKHTKKLIEQKQALERQLTVASSAQNQTDVQQKLALIKEQIEQVKARKEERIFVPADRNDPNINWCEVSAKLNNTLHDSQDCRLMWSNQLHWSLNQGFWSKEEDSCLLNAVRKHGLNDWDSVARELNSNRLPWQCCSRYHQELSHLGNSSNPISREDVQKIVEVINLCRIGDYVPWNQVMYFIKSHNLLQVKYLWHKLCSEEVSNQGWTKEEDNALLKSIEKYGEQDWNRIASSLPGRSNKSCRERYFLRLKHSTRALGGWRRKEDSLLLSLVDKFGTDWRLLSSRFGVRNYHQLRNRYELLKRGAVNSARPIKHRKVYRMPDGTLMNVFGRKPKPSSERELDDKLKEILTTYHTVKTSNKIVYRGVQDEEIYQKLVEIVKNVIVGEEQPDDLLGCILVKAVSGAVDKRTGLFAPSIPTLRGFKAWSVQQDYLNEMNTHAVDIESISSTREYQNVLRIVMSLFFWPALLSKFKPPDIDLSVYPNLSLIERDSKNLYIIREIQKQITKH